MPRVEETVLPGVGVRVEFVVEDGSRVGAVHHRTRSQRKLFRCTAHDRDAVALNLNLSDERATCSLTPSQAPPSRSPDPRLPRTSNRGTRHRLAARRRRVTVRHQDHRRRRVGTRTGASVVAVIRVSDAHPAPAPTSGSKRGHTLVVVGTPENVELVRALLDRRLAAHGPSAPLLVEFGGVILALGILADWPDASPFRQSPSIWWGASPWGKAD